MTFSPPKALVSRAPTLAALTRVFALRSSFRLHLLAVALTIAASPSPSRAERRPPDRFNARVLAGPAVMVSDDQRARPMSFERPAVVGGLYGGYFFLRWLELRLGGHSGAYFAEDASAGGMLGFTGGVRIFQPRAVSPYGSLELGAGVTGTRVRPLFIAQLGLDVAVRDRYVVGPVLGFNQLTQWNGERYSSDARYLSFSLAFGMKLGATPEPPAQPPRLVHRAPPPPPPPPPEAEPEPDVLELMESALPTQRVELLAPVLFAFDSDELEPIGVAMLHEVAETLRQRPDITKLQIEGYSDARGNSGHNRELATRRAERVRSWLIEHGIAPERLVTFAIGESELLESGTNESAHAQNRRVIFRVLETAQP